MHSETKHIAHPRAHTGLLACACALLLALACLAGLAACGAAEERQPQDPTEMSNTGQGENTETGSDTKEEQQGTGDGNEDKQTADEQEEKKASQAKALEGKTICIDAGHGSELSTKPSPNNPDEDVSENINTQPLGTSGEKSGNEYDVNLDVAKYLQTQLEDEGAEVVMVRTTNDVVISPKERAEAANDCNADALIRLHCDSAGSSTRGFLTLIPADTGYQADGDLYKTSQAMGKAMHEHIVEELGLNDRGTAVRSDQGGFNWCKVPCVLFEMGNMDNAKDDAWLADDDNLKDMAVAIANATASYFEDK